MRQAINENRTVQLALLAVLALVGGLLLLKTTKGSGSESSSTTAAGSGSAGTTATAPTEAGTADTGASSTTDTSADPTGVSGASAAQVPANTVPGPGLPKGLLPAYRHGNAIALLVRRAGGIDDALVRDSVGLLRAVPQVKVYVTKAKHIARYSWLTQGVDVSELPVLVVLRPRKLTHGTPTASVSYGFRGPNSILQAVEDALYHGPANRSYHP
jgi:hypothetical protein